jgi:hypothetical protein
MREPSKPEQDESAKLASSLHVLLQGKYRGSATALDENEA